MPIPRQRRLNRNIIEIQLNRLKHNKTPREDEIQGEILKTLDKGTIKIIHGIIENIWSEERLPADRGTALVCPIYKK